MFYTQGKGVYSTRAVIALIKNYSLCTVLAELFIKTYCICVFNVYRVQCNPIPRSNYVLLPFLKIELKYTCINGKVNNVISDKTVIEYK
jgi:hypothetical protein